MKREEEKIEGFKLEEPMNRALMGKFKAFSESIHEIGFR